MTKVLKWLAVIGGIGVFLILVAVLILPRLIDFQQYKPMLEEKIASTTGRSFSVEDLEPSVFPWVGVSFSNLQLGNARGFSEKKFLSVDAFEVRVKLLPLLFKEIRVKRFVLDSPHLVLEKNAAGRGNWEGIGQSSGKPAARQTVEEKNISSNDLPIKSLTVDQWIISNGTVQWIDLAAGGQKTVSGINLQLQDVALDSPVAVSAQARLDDKPIALDGRVGPIGQTPATGTIPFDMTVSALEDLTIKIAGNVSNLIHRPAVDLTLEMAPFSPRNLMRALDIDLHTTDADALSTMALTAGIKGDPGRITISNGGLTLDESKLTFSVTARDFTKPAIDFSVDLNAIDLDRYLPPPAEETETPQAKPKGTGKAAPTESVDYSAFRRLILDGTARIGTLQAAGLTLEDIYVQITGKDGRFNIAPLNVKLYQGKLEATGELNVRQNKPISRIALQMDGIQAGPLLRDALNKDMIEGALNARINLQVSGDRPNQIRQSVNGDGEMRFSEGAIKGIDLGAMLQNIKTAFGASQSDSSQPQTAFTELHIPFTAEKGVIHTPKTILTSPALRATASGDIRLPTEALSLRVEPKIVSSLSALGSTEQGTGITVPVIISGTFESPQFRPDMEGILKNRLEKELASPKIQEKLRDLGVSEEQAKPLEENIKGLLKSFPFGNRN